MDAAPCFATVRLGDAATVTAPDGSLVRVLAALPQASMARFTLAEGAVSVAVRHRTVSELWYVEAGRGEMWLGSGEADTDAVVELAPGMSLSIPVGTAFQFRAARGEDLAAIGVTIPAWPGDDEAELCVGPWTPSVAAGPGLAGDQPSSPSQGPATAL